MQWFTQQQLNITRLLAHSPPRQDGRELGKKQSLITSPRAAAPGQLSPGLLAISSTFSCKDKAPQKTESLFGWLCRKLCMFQKMNCAWLQGLPRVTLLFFDSTGCSTHYTAHQCQSAIIFLAFSFTLIQETESDTLARFVHVWLKKTYIPNFLFSLLLI